MTYSTTYTPYGDYLLDWDLTGSDGSAMLLSSSGGDPVGVTVSTPKNDGEQFELKYGELKSDDVEEPVEATITFDTAVTDLNFQLKDVDQGWFHDDKVTILAYDADGNLVDVEFSDLQAGQTVSGNTIDGGAKLHDEGVTVSVAGPIVKLVIIHDNGESDHESGYIKITDMGFNAVDDTSDGIVEGSAGDDLIDLGYTGDPDGDMVDADDNIFPGKGEDDDVIVAGAGNDTVLAGEGDDLVFGGGGDDLIYGEAGNDTIYGDGGAAGGSGAENLIVNGSFEDTSGMSNTGYGYVATGSLSGWNTLDPNQEIDVHNDGRGGIEASDGENWLDLEASPGNIRVGQDVQGVQDGVEYQLSFDVSDSQFLTSIDGPDENLVNVYWGGALITTIDPSNVGESEFETITLTLTGGAGDGSNRLEFEGTGLEDNQGAAIDNVKLFAINPVVAPDGGNDTINGGEGDDLIYGGAGDDQLDGGAGNDTIYGDGGEASGDAPSDPLSISPVAGATQTLLVWELGQISVNNAPGNDDPFPNNVTGESDVVGSTFTLSAGATPKAVGIIDDDSKFNDGDVSQVLSHTTTLDGITGDAGDRLTPEYAYSVQSSDGETINIYAVELDGNKMVGFVSDKPLTVDETYTFLGRIDTYPDPDYSNLATTWLDDGDASHGGDPIGADAGNDTIDGGEGDDLIYGGGGDDLLMGGAGNDTIYGDYGGDGTGVTTVRESLNWSEAPNFGNGHDADAFTQNTGNVDVSFSILKESWHTDSRFETSNQNIDGIEGDGDPVDATSSFESVTNGKYNEGDYQLGFSDPVSNVSFRVNDIDGDGVVRITAYDADGNKIPVELTGGSKLTLLDTDGVAGADTADSKGGYLDDNSPEYSLLVDIAGPVSTIVIEHDQNGHDNSGVNITDVFFDVEVSDDGASCEPGDDVITGGAGADVMHGEGGNDTFIVTSAEDGAGDVIVGGNGPDDTTDHDVLDLRGAGKVVIDQTADDTDAGAFKGTVTFENGDTLSFSQIEEILADPDNEAPEAMDDTATTDEDKSVTIDVLANDTDPDGDDLEVTSATSPDGTVDINADGTITFTPDQDFNGPTTIEYTVSDGNGGTDTATVTIDVTPVNDDPVGGDDSATTDEDTPVIIDVLSNDTDVDGDTLEVTEVGDPSNGTAEINPDGTITYTPDPDYNGPDSFTYTVSDGNGGTDTATVTIDVTPVNDDPVAKDDAAKGPINMPVIIDVLANDTDVDGDDLEVISAMSPDGTVDINADGTITFTPDTDFFGETTIDYTISDGNGGTDSAVVTVLINDGIVSGTDGDDLIDVNYMGDPEGDMVDADDNIFPGSGPDDDVIEAGDGNDTVLAGLGDDYVDGGAGDDLIDGGDGHDTIIGGDGSDEVYGGAGDDYIDTSGSNPMTDYGYPPFLPEDTDKEDDRDFVDGGDGNDTIFTGDDRDTIYGGAGNDYIDGGLDDDLIHGGDGDDTILGGHGSDEIHGGEGNDLIYGGLGPDPSLDPLNIQDENDPIYGIDDPRPDNGIDVIHGGAGNDTIFGQDDADLLYGDEGDDYIDGGIDNDTIFGGEGDDELLGGQGDDLISGGAGNDTMQGGDDRDTFINVNAGDLIIGGEGGDDFDTLDLTGSVPENGSYQITYTSPDKEDGFVSYFDENNDPAGTLEFFEIENVIPCFTPGTMIATPKGERRVEELKAGDRVITRDNGIQEIKWVGHKPIGFRELATSEHLQPVLIRAGALGNGLPERDMMVSPNHRVLVANDRTALYFDEREVLAAAKHLVDNKGIMSVEPMGVTYVHFMFEHHEVVLSDGAWTESFQPGDHSLKGIGNAQRQELFELFPELETRHGIEDYTAARRILKKHEAQMLVK